MVIRDNKDNFYSCYFENGLEHDVFINRKFGQDSIDNMLLSIF
jgi:hypothetical protein